MEAVKEGEHPSTTDWQLLLSGAVLNIEIRASFAFIYPRECVGIGRGISSSDRQAAQDNLCSFLPSFTQSHHRHHWDSISTSQPVIIQ